MPRDERAYLADVVESCKAVEKDVPLLKETCGRLLEDAGRDEKK
jgi:hypothetical protein